MAELNRRTTAITAIRRIATNIGSDSFSADEFGLQQELESLEWHFERLVAAHDALIEVAEPTELEAHGQLFDEIEILRNTTIAKLRRMMATIKAEDTQAASESGGNSSTMTLKLDPLSVPRFDGTLQNWLAFKDTFETLVHSQDFPEAYKLGKLREAVQGDAVALVGGTYTGGYGEVWKALKKRYDNPRQLAEIHVSRFIGIKQQTVESTSTLLYVVDTMREAFRALKVMELPVESWDALAIPIVTSKIPTATQQAWGMSRTTNEIPKVEELLIFVEKRAHSLSSDVLRWNAVDVHNQPGTRRNLHPSTSTTRLVKSNLAATAPGNCEYCDSKIHRISNCPKLLAIPVTERFGKVRGSNLCYNCLRPGHATKSCPGGKCKVCQGKHHTMLCRVGTSSSTTADSKATTVAPTVTTTSNQPPRNYPA